CDRAAGYDGIGLTEDILAVVKPEQMHLVIASQPLAIGPVHQACVIDAVRNAGVKRDGTTDQPYTMPGSLSRKKPLQGAVAIRLPNSELVRILLAHQTEVFRKQNQSRPLLGSLLDQDGSVFHVLVNARRRYHLNGSNSQIGISRCINNMIFHIKELLHDDGKLTDEQI